MIDVHNILEGVKQNPSKEIFQYELPSQGLFYNSDMRFILRKISQDDIDHFCFIEQYTVSVKESEKSIKYLLRKYVFYGDTKYTLDDVCYCDIMYLFWELASLTINKRINIATVDTVEDEIPETAIFSSSNFEYFDYTPYMDKYDEELKIFKFDNFMFSLTTVGQVDSLIKYRDSLDKYISNADFDNMNLYFLFFCKRYRTLDFKTIENLLNIFNNDLDSSVIEQVEGIVSKFSSINTYLLRSKTGKVIYMSDYIPLSKILCL